MPRATSGFRARSQVLSARPDGTAPIYLGSLGHVPDLVTTDTMPGGNETLTCTLQADPRWRHEALSPGRIIRAIRGGVQWEGILDEPVPQDDGWHLTAAGAGTWGGSYQAICNSWTVSDVITQATGRGLGWVAGSLTGGYLGSVQDSGSLTVADFLNNVTSPGSYTWRVHRTFAGNQLDLLPVPATPTRLLIAAVPAARTLAGYYNVLWVRYQATADAGGGAATYAVTSASNAASIAKHGRREAYWDLSSAGVMIAATAQAYATSALAKYTAATYAGPYTVTHGQYLTMGGAPVDLGCEHSGEVARLILADGPYGGEVAPSPPVQFPVGKLEYRDADGTAIITPYQSWTADLSGLLQILTPKAPA